VQGPLGKEFTNVDGEQTTAYCGFGKIMGEDFIDGYASREVEGGNATNMQCLMWACDEHEGKIPYDYWYKCRFDMNVGISFPLVFFPSSWCGFSSGSYSWASLRMATSSLRL